jgi:serine/threonine-protein kinase RsbW
MTARAADHAGAPSDSCPGPSVVARDWRLPNDVQGIEPVVTDIVALCRAAGFSQRHCALNVPVAVTEAIANAMLRGNACAPELMVAVTVEVSIEQLVVEVCDQGCGFDLQAVQQSPDDDDWFEREDGRGVFLMRSLMDRVENDRHPDTGDHRLRLVLYRT